MNVKLYKMNDPDNKLNKSLMSEKDVDGNFRGPVDIQSPVISLTGFNYKDYNYCYIEKLDRYYFITDITIKRKDFLVMQLDIDVLQSHKAKIKTGRGTAVESDHGDKYMNGFIENTDVRPIVDKYEFLDKFDHSGNFYLTVAVVTE